MDRLTEPPLRRDPTDPGYASLSVFKSDLKAAVAAASPTGSMPTVTTMVDALGLSRDAIHYALTSASTRRPSPETIYYIAGKYDPAGRNYWRERLEAVLAVPKEDASGKALSAAAHQDQPETPVEEIPDDHLVAGDADANTNRRRWLPLALTCVVLIAAAASVIGVVLMLDGDGNTDGPSVPVQTTADPAAPIPSDLNDPARVGCLSDANRVESEQIETVGLVSLVHSPKCDAYWGRAERLDGKAVGNHIDVKLTATDSERASSANDRDADVVYTYLLTRGTATEFCVEATFWTGTESVKFRQICVRTQTS